MDFDLPHAREQDARIRRIDGDLRAAGVLVGEQRALPARAAVGRPEHAALRLRTERRPQRARENDLRVHRIDDDTADAPDLLEPHARPGLAGVARFVDPLADRDVTANPCLAGPGPDNVWIRWRDRERADRLHGLIVEDLLPVHAAVSRLGDAARRAPRVVDERIAGNSGDRRNPVALWPDVAPAKAAVDVWTGTRRLTLRDQPRTNRQ